MPTELGGAAVKRDLASFCVAPERSLRDALEAIGRNQVGIVLVCDSERRLLGTVTDGDLRRAILAGESLFDSLSESLARRPSGPGTSPLTAPLGTHPARALARMREARVRHLPILAEDGVVVDLFTLDDLAQEPALEARALVLAGGFGRRMSPFTDDTPKPMLRVGTRPMLETTIAQLREAGVCRIAIATHYRSEQIVDFFGDGSQHGVELEYVNETEPLGTAGALAWLAGAASPILVVNGDLVTRVSFRAILAFHRDQNAMLTVASRKYSIEVPYGVVEAFGARVTRVIEKPELAFLVNAGIYVVEPEVIPLVPRGRRCDMTELIDLLLARRAAVATFPVVEYWLDVGRPADLERARAESERI